MPDRFPRGGNALKNAITLGSSGDGPGLWQAMGLGQSRGEMRARLPEIQQEFARPSSPRYGAAAASSIVPGAGFDDPAMNRAQAMSYSNSVRARQAEEADIHAKAMHAERERQAQAKREAEEERKRRLAEERERLLAEAESLAGRIDPRLEGVAAGINVATFADTSQAADAIGKAMGMGAPSVTQGDRMIVKELQRVEKRIREIGSEVDVIV